METAFDSTFYFVCLFFILNCRNDNEAQHSTRKVFDCLYVKWYGRRNYPILFKFVTNVYMLSENGGITLGVHCPNSACTGMYQNISIRYCLWKKMCIFSACSGRQHSQKLSDLLEVLYKCLCYGKLAIYTALQKLRYNLFWCFLVLRIILE